MWRLELLSKRGAAANQQEWRWQGRQQQGRAAPKSSNCQEHSSTWVYAGCSLWAPHERQQVW